METHIHVSQLLLALTYKLWIGNSPISVNR